MSSFETMNEMLIACVKASGGSKVVGPVLFPEKVKTNKDTGEINTEPAQRWLLNCLDEHRAEKITPDQALLIMRLAREKGKHIGISYLCESLGYSVPNPIEPEDVRAQLQTEFIEAQKEMAALAKRMEAIGLLKAVA